MWQQYVNAFLGLCILGAAFLNLTGSTLTWTFGVLGAAVIFFALWGGALSPESSLRHAS